MRKTIRNNVFETNSSAVHSLAISPDGLEPSNLPVDEDGYIVTDFGNYGDYNVGITSYDQALKLSYLATECYYLNHYNEDIEDYYEWQHICEYVQKYANANGVRLLKKTTPELNHQVIPEYETKFCDPWDYDSVINFIFNKYAGIKMSHD